MRRLGFIILAVALVAGGWLRFSGLGKYEMTSDEGVTWAPAAMPTLSEVFRVTPTIDTPKFGVWHGILHLWIGVFGDQLTTMRALSAALGTVDIALIFLFAERLFRADPDGRGFLPPEQSRLVGAATALVFALSIGLIRYSHNLRMYSFLLAVVLLQGWFLIGAAYRGGLLNYTGAGLLAAIAGATNLDVLSLFVAEGLWALYLLQRRGWRPLEARSRYAWGLGIALALAGAVLALLIPWHLLFSTVHQAWEKPAVLYGMRQSMARSRRRLILPLTVGLAGWGAIMSWRRAPEPTALILLWLSVPVLMLTLYVGKPIVLLVAFAGAWFPVWCDRYVLLSLAAFCLLIALGIWELRANAARLGALALVVLLAIGRIHGYKPAADEIQLGTQWQEAAEIVAPALREGKAVNVLFNPFAERYYLRNKTGVNLELLQANRPDAQMLIMSAQFEVFNKDAAAALRRTYPHVVSRLERLWVLRR